MAASLLVISTRKEDIEFVTAVGKKLGLPVIVGDQQDKLVETLFGGPPGLLVFWDIDHPDYRDNKHPLALPFVQNLLSDGAKPQRVFTLTDKTMNQYAELLHAVPEMNKRVWQHNLLRRYTPGALELYPRLIATAINPTPQGLAPFFGAGVRIQKIQLKKSEQRKAAVDAMESFLSKLGLENRIASRAAQATDELLMNAIFDAAIDKTGRQTRQILDRKSKFDFGANELVTIEAAASDKYIGISATDLFGSLKAESVLKFLGQNYHDGDYTPRKTGPGAGLGIYGIVESGISLLYLCQPTKRTDAFIFFPRTQSYKEFKTGFQFTACYSTAG